MAKPRVYWMAERSERTHVDLDLDTSQPDVTEVAVRIHLDEADNAEVLAMTVPQRLVVERLIESLYGELVAPL